MAEESMAGGYHEQQNSTPSSPTEGADRSVSVKLDPSFLPQDLIIQLACYVDPWDIVRYRRVSRQWNTAFSDPYLLQRILRQDFKQTREVRILLENDLFDDLIGGQLKSLFDRIACRYYHLTHAKPCSVLKLRCTDATVRGPIFYPVGPWDYHESREERFLPGQQRTAFDHAFWSYDDGLLVYPAIDHERLVILDLETEITTPVPFDHFRKIIRNFRLKHNILIIEWAEANPFHNLNIEVSVHRHFVSLYRIHRSSPTTLSITFHAELKLHFLGLPLTERDRLFSTHTQIHYAIYFWQPNRSMYTGDEEEPIESLLIWDITSSSTYLPSLDPSNQYSNPGTEGPKSIARFSFRDLDFYGIRQRSNPTLMTFSLSEGGFPEDPLSDAPGILTVHSTSRTYLTGYFDPSTTHRTSSITSIPFLTYGPHNHISSSPELSYGPYVGNCTLSSSPSPWDESTTHLMEDWVNLIDPSANVWLSLSRTLFKGTGSGVENYTLIRIMAMERECGMDAKTAEMVMGGEKGKLEGDERWLIGEDEQGCVNVLRFDR